MIKCTVTVNSLAINTTHNGLLLPYPLSSMFGFGCRVSLCPLKRSNRIRVRLLTPRFDCEPDTRVFCLLRSVASNELTAWPQIFQSIIRLRSWVWIFLSFLYWVIVHERIPMLMLNTLSCPPPPPPNCLRGLLVIYGWTVQCWAQICARSVLMLFYLYLVQISAVRLPREPSNPERLKGFGYAEFDDVDSLLRALSLNEEVRGFNIN